MNPLFSSITQAPTSSINTSIDMHNSTNGEMYPGAQPRTSHRYNELLDPHEAPSIVSMNLPTSPTKYNISTEKKS